jgi:hypothetical protein
MKNDAKAEGPAIVTGATWPKQTGAIRDRWWWIEHSVWTDRLLTRLEQSEPTTVSNRWFAAQGLWSLERGSCAYG